MHIVSFERALCVGNHIASGVTGHLSSMVVDRARVAFQSTWLITLVVLCLCPFLPGGMPEQDDILDNDAASVLFSEGGESLGRAGSALSGLAISIVTYKICRLCNCRSDSASPLREGGVRPWLHYRKIVENGIDMREASGKICAICHRVFMISSLRLTHGSIAAYIAWKNSGDGQARHSSFMRGLRSYIGCVNRQEGRLHTRPFRFLFCFGICGYAS